MPGRLDKRPARKRPRADTAQADSEGDDDDYDVDDTNPSPRNVTSNVGLVLSTAFLFSLGLPC